MADEITALIVDDHEVVREGLRLSLSRAPHIRVDRRGGRRRLRGRARGAPQARRRDHGRADAGHGRARGDEAPHPAGSRLEGPDLHRLLGALAAQPRARIRREGLHPQGGAAPDARARDREGGAGEGYVDPGTDAGVPRRQGPDRHADRRASARSCSSSPTACRTPTSPAASSSRRRRSRATSATSSRSSRPTRAPTPSRSRSARRSSIRRERWPPRRLDRLIAAEQDERRRIALFLHDGPVQNLAGIALMLDATLHSIETGKLEDAKKVLSSALDRQRLTIRELRDLSFALEPVVLRDQGFAAALQALAEQVGETQPAAHRPRRRRGGATGRDGAGRAVHDHPRAARPGDPARAADAGRACDDGGRRRRRRDARLRRCGARAAAPVVRGDRGARQAAARHDRR